MWSTHATTALALAALAATACGPTIERGAPISATSPPPAAIAESARRDDGRMRGLPDTFGWGRVPTDDEIRRWDIDVLPDGEGLPDGSGSVTTGAVIYQRQCAVCHGPRGGGAEFDRLAGREPRAGFPFGTDARLLDLRTIGNYWPYAPTLFDYVRRAMPQSAPGTLLPDEVYAVVAYLLYLNELLPEGAVLDRERLQGIAMPARDRFVLDNRRGGPEIR